MTPATRRLVPLSVVVLIVGALAFALLRGGDDTATGQGIPAAGTVLPPPPALPAAGTPGPAATDVRRVAPLQPSRRRVDVQLQALSAPIIALKVRDPDGGPAWAVRVVRANRVVRKSLRRPGVDPVVGRNRCLQLGRIHQGRFGWLDAAGVFRPAPINVFATTGTCKSARRFDRARYAQVLTTITDPSRPRAAARRTIVWGTGGGAARDITLTVDGKRHTVKVGRFGVALAVLPPKITAASVKLTAARPSGGVTLWPLSRRDGYRPPGSSIPERYVTGAKPRVAATAPDPAGGLPYATVAVPATDGGYCLSQPARLVGDRVGRIDYDLDVLFETQLTNSDCPVRDEQAPRRLPFTLRSEAGVGSGMLGDDPAPGRRARRLPAGHVIYSGLTDPDVKTLTFATPQDVRTITPTSQAHGYLVVYGGTFPTGQATVTTTRSNGTTQTDQLPGAAP